MLGLAHPNSGDLIVFLTPGFPASSSLHGKLIEPSRFYAQHGYLNHHHSMDGIFFARGKGIKAQKVNITYIVEIVKLNVLYDTQKEKTVKTKLGARNRAFLVPVLTGGLL